MKILRTIFLFPLALLRLVLIVLATSLLAIVGVCWYKLFGFSRQLQQWILSSWGKIILVILNVRIEHNELPQLNNFILMPNHRGYLDIFIVSALTPSAIVAKAELKNWPLVRIGLKITNAILVERNNSGSLIQTMKRIKAAVEQGIPVTLFPEGTTYKGPLTKDFKNGSFKIAAESGIPVIPLAIDFHDTEDAWVDDDTFIAHFFRQMGKPVTRVTLRFAPPVTMNDFSELRNRVKTTIDQMLTEIQQERKSAKSTEKK